MFALPTAVFPWLFKTIFQIPGLDIAKKAVDRVDAHAETSIKKYLAFVEADYNGALQRPTLFTKLLAAKEEGSLTETELTREAMAYSIAGTDTTAITFSYLIWLVAQRPDLQARIQEELRDAVLDNQTLKANTFLEHLIDEILRLYGAAPGPLHRTVPAGGAKMGDFFIPGNLTVSTQGWTLHRDPQVFEDPESFNPDRWKEPTQAMKDSFMPWGGGARCKLLTVKSLAS